MGTRLKPKFYLHAMRMGAVIRVYKMVRMNTKTRSYTVAGFRKNSSRFEFYGTHTDKEDSKIIINAFRKELDTKGTIDPLGFS